MEEEQIPTHWCMSTQSISKLNGENIVKSNEKSDLLEGSFAHKKNNIIFSKYHHMHNVYSLYYLDNFTHSQILKTFETPISNSVLNHKDAFISLDNCIYKSPLEKLGNLVLLEKKCRMLSDSSHIFPIYSNLVAKSKGYCNVGIVDRNSIQEIARLSVKESPLKL